MLGFSKITRDLTERRRHEAALLESEERFRLLVESVVDYAIVTLDGDGMITSWNSGAERINGYRASEILGRHFSRLYPPEDIRDNKPWRQLAAARERGRVNDEAWRIRRDGTQYWANNVIASLPEHESHRRAYYMVTQDLSQRRHAESLADTAQRMHEFIAMLAHELRNPLAPIRNAVTLMARRKLDDPLIEAMRQTIDRQSQNLTRIVDDLLDVNRVARGQFVIDKQVIDLRDVLTRAIETSRPLIDAHGHRLHVAIAEQPIACVGDSLRLAQVFINILNNAAKYTPDGGDIWLDCRNRRRAHRSTHSRQWPRHRTRCASTGCSTCSCRSIRTPAARSADWVWAWRWCGESSSCTGAVCRRSATGSARGSEFVVRLPVGGTPDSVSAGDPLPLLPDSSPPLRALVIDDNKDAADSFCMLMKAMGHNVRAAYDGPSGIVVAQEFDPDVVMLDIGMPGMSGYEVARALRGESSSHVLVAVTGWGDEAAKRLAREAGFDHHLVKPVHESVLIDLLASISKNRPATR